MKLCSLPHSSSSAPPDSVDFGFFGSNEIENEIKKCVLGRKGKGRGGTDGEGAFVVDSQIPNGIISIFFVLS
mgnify:CR=1 FL=1